MRLSTMLKGVALAGAVTTVALIGAVKAIDLDKVKTLLARQVKEATGRELVIAGPLELKLGFSPQLVANGVTLANAPGGSRKDMLTIDRIEARLALIPLLKRTIVVKRLLLNNPDLLLEADTKGHGNWEANPVAAAMPTATGTPPTRFEVGEMVLRNGHVAWRLGGGHAGWVSLHKIAIQPSPDGAQLRLQALGDWQGTVFELGGNVGALAQVGPTRPWPIQLKGAIAKGQMVIDGSVADPFAGKGVDLQVEVQGDELSQFLSLAGITAADKPPSAVGPFRLAARLSDSGGRLQATGLDAAIGRHDQALVSARGEVKDLAAGRGIDLRLTMESDNLGGLSRLAAAELPPIGPLKLSARLSDEGAGWRFADIKAGLADSDLAGELTVDAAGRPHVGGTLTANTLALANFFTPAAKPGEKRAAAPPPRPGARLFPDNKLPLGALAAFDADLSLSAAHLIAGPFDIEGMTTRLHLDHGRLALAGASGHLAGGTIGGALTVDAQTANGAQAALRIDGAGIDLGKLAQQATDSRAIGGGPTRVRIDVKARGGSARALMASLNGEMLVAVGEARIHNQIVDWTGGDLLWQLAGKLDPTAKAEETTTLKCAVVHFVARDGVATAAKGIAAETSRADVVGSGTIDLRNEALDLGFAPRARQGLGLSLGGAAMAATRVRGTLAEPSVGIDEIGAARAVASAGAAVATGGLSLLGELLLDRATADDHPCQTALGKTGTAKPAKSRKRG